MAPMVTHRQLFNVITATSRLGVSFVSQLREPHRPIVRRRSVELVAPARHPRAIQARYDYIVLRPFE
jgi:hypothetical protein